MTSNLFKVIPFAKFEDISNFNYVTEDERLEMLNWLSDVPTMSHHEYQQSLRHAGTGGWLLDKDSFRNWEDSDSSALLWLNGPGKNNRVPSNRILALKLI